MGQTSIADSIEKFVAGQRLANEAETIRLRNLSLEERGQMIEAACRTAADLSASRREAGLPELVSIPWPRSTFEFLAKHQAARARSFVLTRKNHFSVMHLKWKV